MKSILYYIIIFLNSILVSNAIYSQGLSPLEVVQKMFAREGFKNFNEYLCCEIKENSDKDSTFGQLIPKSTSAIITLIYQNDSNAMVSVNLSDTSVNFDLYYYLKHKDRWMIEAMRSLALTGIAHKLVEQLDTLSEYERKNTYYTNDSTKSLEFLYQQSKLEISNDKELISNFNKRKVEFLSLLTEVELLDTNKYYFSIYTDENDLGKKRGDSLPVIREKLNNLFLLTIEIGYNSAVLSYCPNCVFFVIGGILDNTVGYFYCYDKKDLPGISKSKFIIIREIGNGWYLYKTT